MFDDPRIHAAVVCASVGWPMLRGKAHAGERVGAQLDNAMRRFLSDPSRNRFDAQSGSLSASKLFDSYHADFEHGHQGIDSLQSLFTRCADVLGTTSAARAEVRTGRFEIRYLDHDWSLNGARRSMDAVKPALCIVVPVLDEAPNLAACLVELQHFRERGALVVVVDGGSADNSFAIARDLADLAFVASQGRARQMNAGAAACTGELLLFLHADTRLPHDADALVRRALQGRRRWGRFDVTIDSQRPLMRVVEALMNLRSRLTGIATGDQAIFVRKDLFDLIGGFPNQPLMEDIALSTQLKRHGPPACLRERVTTSARRWERQGPWRSILLMWRLRAAYFLGADPAKLALRYGYRAPPP